jgi:hypothetical protein
MADGIGLAPAPGEEPTAEQRRALRFSPQEREAMRAMDAANPKYAGRPGDTLKASDIPLMGQSAPDDAIDRQ